MGYRELLRRQLLEKLYDKMTTEEKKAFVQLTIENKSHEEIMRALSQQRSELDEIHRNVTSQTWLSDFSSNIAGNALWDGLVWIGSKLFRKL